MHVPRFAWLRAGNETVREGEMEECAQKRFMGKRGGGCEKSGLQLSFGEMLCSQALSSKTRGVYERAWARG